jgi:hypothetical protein
MLMDFSLFAAKRALHFTILSDDGAPDRWNGPAAPNSCDACSGNINFGSIWHMRFFINAMLAFAFAGFAAGLVPAPAHTMAGLQTMKTELAVAEAAQQIKLRPSILHRRSPA